MQSGQEQSCYRNGTTRYNLRCRPLLPSRPGRAKAMGVNPTQISSSYHPVFLPTLFYQCQVHWLWSFLLGPRQALATKCQYAVQPVAVRVEIARSCSESNISIERGTPN